MSYNILLIGEFAIDETIYGNVTRICPEAPVPVFVPKRQVLNDGMAGNVYNNLLSLSNNNVNIDFIRPQLDIIKRRFVDEASGYLLLRVDEDNNDDSFDILSFELEYLDRVKYDFCVISDYHKGFLDQYDIENIANKCKSRNIPTILDTKKILGNWSQNITFVKINEKEHKAQWDNGCSLPAYFCENLIVTLGPIGAKLIVQDQITDVFTYPVEVRDVCGAGDVFMSAFVIKYLETSGNVVDAIKFANKAAGLSVTKKGTVTIQREEVL